MAFASHRTGNPDAFVVLNMANRAVPLVPEVRGTGAVTFDVTRTGAGEAYVSLGEAALNAGALRYSTPAGSVTTFVGECANAPSSRRR
jgi:hypothetical protein